MGMASADFFSEVWGKITERDDKNILFAKKNTIFLKKVLKHAIFLGRHAPALPPPPPDAHAQWQIIALLLD
jgi:hypothetical protein